MADQTLKPCLLALRHSRLHQAKGKVENWLLMEAGKVQPQRQPVTFYRVGGGEIRNNGLRNGMFD